MKVLRFCLSAIASICVITSCQDSNKEAKAYLENIHRLYNAQEYDSAKQKIDSIQILYPKAFEQIKEGLALLQDVRKAQDSKQIAYCDSIIAILTVKTDSIKQGFILEKNKEYQETGRFVPKHLSSTSLSGNFLRSGVDEDGLLYIESVYTGSQLHNMIKVQTKDGVFTETLPVDDDGLNFRFNNLGRQYEVIKFSKEDENGLAKFISANADKPLTVVLKGKNSLTYPLSNLSKRAISDSYQLSLLMSEIDSLKNIKEISLIRIEYLNRKQQSDSIQTNE